MGTPQSALLPEACRQDKLLDYTQAVTGASFLVPSLEFLAAGAP